MLGSNPERAARFTNAMKVFATSPGLYPVHIIKNYDWASLGNARVVDVGGAQGHVAMELANRFGNLAFVVQDMDQVIEDAEAGLPASLKGRVSFMAHDLFAPQTVHADVFFFRWVFDNWSNKYCVGILRAQIPALKLNARLIIQDGGLPEPGTVALWREKVSRYALRLRFNLKIVLQNPD